MGSFFYERDYEAGDEKHILRLFKAVYGRILHEEFWKWRYIQNPFGSGIIRLMFDEEELVGHYAVIPLPLQVADEQVKAAFSMTTMTHPDYQGRGIFSKLASEIYDRCRREGIRVVFGFPNQNSYHGFTGKLGWRGFNTIRYLELNSKTEPLSAHTEYACHRIYRFDDDIDIFWGSARERFSIIVPRESTFLNWRYVEKPDSDYAIFTVKNDMEDVLGYMVLKVFVEGKIRVGHIIDICISDEPQAALSLLEEAHAYFYERDVDVINTWVPSSNSVFDILKGRGYSVKNWNTYFGVKVISEEDELVPVVEQVSNWWFTMGDSDVF